MDFFNRLGERAKELGEKAMEVGRKPTGLVGITKLRYEVTKLKKAMEHNIEAIGELMYRQFKGELGLEPEIERLLQSTKGLEEGIFSLEQQIEELQPKPLTCPQCEIELPGESLYCNQCGLQVQSKEEAETAAQEADEEDKEI